MPPTEQDGKKEHWFSRTIRGWRTFWADVRHWGPLAVREIVDDCHLAIGSDRGIAIATRLADQELPKK
jgi:hypothetical protein